MTCRQCQTLKTMNCFNQSKHENHVKSILTGEQISSWSEHHRYECEILHCLKLDKEKRQDYLQKKRAKHGDKAAEQFKRDAEFVFKSRK